MDRLFDVNNELGQQNSVSQMTDFYKSGIQICLKSNLGGIKISFLVRNIIKLSPLPGFEPGISPVTSRLANH